MSAAGVSANGARLTRLAGGVALRRFMWGLGGLAILCTLWGIGGYLIAHNPATRSFGTFGLLPTLEAFPTLWGAGKIQHAVASSAYRMGFGLGLAIVIGVPVGILMGRVKRFRDFSNSPFQFLRMISPLSWMPLAVLVFPTWDGSIVFLIAFASVWPVLFQTSAGLAKVDPNWFKVARNLGAKPWHMLTRLIIPAITFDVLTGIRLALGVAWIVLVPAEFLGVTSGLGYAIEDARETLSYNHLTAMVTTIGVIGYVLDSLLVMLIKHFSWHRGGVS
jgi:NitT/TauT family transport system permease protein